MITTLAVENYRSLRDVVLPLGRLTLVTGANGTGKSSLYQAFRLLADTATGQFVGSLARSGGLASVLWAGPEHISGAMRRGEVPVQGTGSRSKAISLQMGFASDEFGYLIDVGLPVPNATTMFARDPELKRELVWSGPVMRPATVLVERKRALLRVRDGGAWRTVTEALGARQPLLSTLADPLQYPELAVVRGEASSWRFYDSFRVDPASPTRAPQVGTWTPVLAHDGANLAAAAQTVLESAYGGLLAEAVDDAFPGSRLEVVEADGWFSVQLRQPGLLRPLSATELSDGTLRFLLLATALMSPQPPSLMVLNEPETSLHPELVPAVGRLIAAAAERTQVVVVTHAGSMIEALEQTGEGVLHHELVKDLGETRIAGQGLLTTPSWNWGRR